MGKRYGNQLCWVLSLLIIIFSPVSVSAIPHYSISYDSIVEGIEYGEFSRDVQGIIDFHYDNDQQRGLLVTMSGLFVFDDQSSQSSDTNNIFYSMEGSLFELPPNPQSVYHDRSNSIIYTSEYMTGHGRGVHQFWIDNNVVLTDSFAIPVDNDFELFEVKDLVYDLASNKLLIICYSESQSTLFSFLYDFFWASWLEIQMPFAISDNSYIQLSGNAEKNTALLYINDFEFDENENRIVNRAIDENTYEFDFERENWIIRSTRSKPSNLIDFQIIYSEKIQRHILLGGTHADTNLKNKDIWIYDPHQNDWVMIFRNTVMLDEYTDPTAYYDPYLDRIIAFARVFWSINNYTILNIDISIDSAAGYKIDFGMEQGVLLLGVVMPVSTFSFLMTLYVYRKRAIIFAK